mmetsp:Transcript_25467/g.77359  ORF Transcript_25467/g.77359 Transcript_25467/m.77359 type:complete len:84 (+) Transcript_25467:1197-1448(+)
MSRTDELCASPVSVSPVNLTEVVGVPPRSKDCEALIGGGAEGGGGDSSIAACVMASSPFGQKVHARHLHQRQWNFLNFSLQKL